MPFAERGERRVRQPVEAEHAPSARFSEAAADPDRIQLDVTKER